MDCVTSVICGMVLSAHDAQKLK